MVCYHVLRTLSSTTGSSSVSSHGNGLLLLLNVLQELDGTLQLPSVDGLGGLTSVLERNSEVSTASAGGLGWVNLGGGVTDLENENVSKMLC